MGGIERGREDVLGPGSFFPDLVDPRCYGFLILSPHVHGAVKIIR